MNLNTEKINPSQPVPFQLPSGLLGERLRIAVGHWRERQAQRRHAAWCEWLAWLDSAEGQAWLEAQAEIQAHRRAGLYG